jgi:hypothetical protein
MVTSLIPMNGTKSLQWCSDSNPQYLGVESASLTTRPRLAYRIIFTQPVFSLWTMSTLVDFNHPICFQSQKNPTFLWKKFRI